MNQKTPVFNFMPGATFLFTVGAAAAAVGLTSCGPGNSGTSNSAADSMEVPTRPSDTAGASSMPQGISREKIERPVELSTDKSEYRAGDPLELTLANPTEEMYSYNFCTRIVERELNGSWTTVDEPGRVCTMEASQLGPSGSRSGKTELPEAISNGRYRIVISLLLEKNQSPPTQFVLATSAPITIVP